MIDSCEPQCGMEVFLAPMTRSAEYLQNSLMNLYRHILYSPTLREEPRTDLGSDPQLSLFQYKDRRIQSKNDGHQK